VRPQLADLACALHGQACHHIAQVGVGVMHVHARRLDQTHDGRRPLARAQAACEEPVVAANRNGADLVLDSVVVHGQLPVTREPGQRIPPPQAVVQRLGTCRALGHFLALQHHPLVQGIKQWLRLLLPDGLALIPRKLLDLALDLVVPRELLQSEFGDLALIGGVQIEELAPRVRFMRSSA